MNINGAAGARKTVLGLALMTIAVSSQAQEKCYRVDLKPPRPLWITSAAFAEALEKIAVVDPLRNNILLINPETGSVEPYNGKRLVEPGEEMLPAILNREDKGFVLTMVDQRLYRLDQNLKKVGTTENLKNSSGPRGSIASTYDSVYSGGDFLSIGAVKVAPRKFQYGFFRFPSRVPSEVTFLKDQGFDYYLLGHKYLTGLGKDFYAILMTPSEKPEIIQFSEDGTQRTLDVIPPPYNEKIVLLKTENDGPISEVSTFQEIEKLTIPVGLYGQAQDGRNEGLLYLLTREPAGTRTKWNLFQIDPKGSLKTKRLTLPTTANANHLTIVPTNNQWYIFEKGPVLPFGQQQIESLLVIQTSAIKSQSVPSACPTHK
jgi:hypothetical protein